MSRLENLVLATPQQIEEPSLNYFSDHGGEVVYGHGYRMLCRPMVIREAAWWQEKKVNHEVLDWFEVKMVKRIEIEDLSGSTRLVHIANGDMAFALPWGDDRHRLIRPGSRYQESIWLGGQPEEDCFGWSMLPRRGEVVWVVPDEFEVMRLFEKGIPAICSSHPFGSLSTQQQLELSKRFRMTFVVGDVGRRMEVA